MKRRDKDVAHVLHRHYVQLSELYPYDHDPRWKERVYVIALDYAAERRMTDEQREEFLSAVVPPMTP